LAFIDVALFKIGSPSGNSLKSNYYQMGPQRPMAPLQQPGQAFQTQENNVQHQQNSGQYPQGFAVPQMQQAPNRFQVIFLQIN